MSDHFIIAKHADPSVSQHYWEEDPTKGSIHHTYSIYNTHTGRSLRIKPYYRDKDEAQKDCARANKENPTGAYAVCVMRQDGFEFFKERLGNFRQWNKPDPEPKNTREYVGDTRVRPTSYLEIHEMVGTSGCSVHHPYWSWSAMGIIDSTHGRMIVNPGDWITEILPDKFIVLSDEEYQFIKNME